MDISEMRAGRAINHGINDTELDFVYGLEGTPPDWHEKSKFFPKLEKAMFPVLTPEFLVGRESGAATGQQMLRHPSGRFIGKAFTDSFGYVTPQQAWDVVNEALAGTDYNVERLFVLKTGTMWGISVKLMELEKLTLPGRKTFLNCSGSLVSEFLTGWQLWDERACCQNTALFSRMFGDNLGTVKQTKNSALRLPSVVENLEKHAGMLALWNAALGKMANQKISNDTARALFAGEIVRNGGELKSESLTKSGERRESRAAGLVQYRMDLFNGAGIEIETGTRIGAMDVVTQDLTRGRPDSTKDRWLAVESSMIGGNSRRKTDFVMALQNEGEFQKLAREGKAALLAAGI